MERFGGEYASRCYEEYKKLRICKSNSYLDVSYHCWVTYERFYWIGAHWVGKISCFFAANYQFLEEHATSSRISS
jgi:hypothetical protein